MACFTGSPGWLPRALAASFVDRPLQNMATCKGAHRTFGGVPVPALSWRSSDRLQSMWPPGAALLPAVWLPGHQPCTGPECFLTEVQQSRAVSHGSLAERAISPAQACGTCLA